MPVHFYGPSLDILYSYLLTMRFEQRHIPLFTAHLAMPSLCKSENRTGYGTDNEKPNQHPKRAKPTQQHQKHRTNRTNIQKEQNLHKNTKNTAQTSKPTPKKSKRTTKTSTPPHKKNKPSTKKEQTSTAAEACSHQGVRRATRPSQPP